MAGIKYFTMKQKEKVARICRRPFLIFKDNLSLLFSDSQFIICNYDYFLKLD